MSATVYLTEAIDISTGPVLDRDSFHPDEYTYRFYQDFRVRGRGKLSLLRPNGWVEFEDVFVHITLEWTLRRTEARGMETMAQPGEFALGQLSKVQQAQSLYSQQAMRMMEDPGKYAMRFAGLWADWQVIASGEIPEEQQDGYLKEAQLDIQRALILRASQGGYPVRFGLRTDATLKDFQQDPDFQSIQEKFGKFVK